MIFPLPDAASWIATVQEGHVEAAGIRHGRLNMVSLLRAAGRTQMQVVDIKSI